MLVGFYAMWFSFLALFIACIVTISILSLKKQLENIGTKLALAVLAVFSFIIVAVCSYDFYQYNYTDGLFAAGQCHVAYIKGGQSISVTKITIDGEVYTIKSDVFKKIEDGVYKCEIAYMPLTKSVYELNLE